MVTKDEINGWIQGAWNTYNKYNNIVKDCNKKIDRLKPVYKALGEIKKNFHSEKKSTMKVFQEKGSWRGEKHTDFQEDGSELDELCERYYNTLDRAQDEVNRKIADLEAKKLELIPIMGKIWGQIERWSVELNNLVN